MQKSWFSHNEAHLITIEGSFPAVLHNYVDMLSLSMAILIGIHATYEFFWKTMKTIPKNTPYLELVVKSLVGQHVYYMYD